MKAYFFIVSCLTAVILIHITFRTVLADWIIPDLGLTTYRSGYELAAIDFNFFSSRVKNNYVSQGYGRTPFAGLNYPGGWHNGIDIVAALNAPIISASEGKVVAIGNQDDFCPKRGYGKFVAVEDEKNGSTLLYAHLGEINVKNEQGVKRGQIIAHVGETGFETAPHLHFTVFQKGTFKLKTKAGCGPSPTGKDESPYKYLDGLGYYNPGAYLSLRGSKNLFLI